MLRNYDKWKMREKNVTMIEYSDFHIPENKICEIKFFEWTSQVSFNLYKISGLKTILDTWFY